MSSPSVEKRSIKRLFERSHAIALKVHIDSRLHLQLKKKKNQFNEGVLSKFLNSTYLIEETKSQKSKFVIR